MLGECCATVGKCFAMVGKCLAMVGECFAMLGECFAMLGECFAMLGECFATLGECLATWRGAIVRQCFDTRDSQPRLRRVRVFVVIPRVTPPSARCAPLGTRATTPLTSRPR